MNDKLLDAFSDALGRVLAEERREWEKERERIQAEARALVAELKAENASLQNTIKDSIDDAERRVTVALARVKDGAAGRDGEPGTQGPKGDAGVRGERGERGETGAAGEKGEAGRDGRDGASIIGLVIDRAGHLVATLADGVSRDLGLIVGKDGIDGKDGAAGSAGRDGFGFEDLSAEIVNERDLVLTFIRGEERKAFALPLPIVVDRGVFKAGTEYRRGDSVTWAGSSWIAQEDTIDKPDTGKGWRLAVKRGRDGRDGKDGAQGERGPQGPKGDPGARY